VYSACELFVRQTNTLARQDVFQYAMPLEIGLMATCSALTNYSTDLHVLSGALRRFTKQFVDLGFMRSKRPKIRYFSL